MSDGIEFRRMQEEDINRVFEMIKGSFDEFVAPGYSKQGVSEFMSYINKDSMLERFKSGSLTILAEDGDKVVGAIEMRGNDHISLFFVDSSYHGRGIGRQLYNLALSECLETYEVMEKLTVNSSPYAVDIYKKLGFKETEPETEINGIRFVPMESEVKKEE